MVRPSMRSRTLRRVKVKTPGGETKVHFRLRKPAHAKCAVCKNPLKGTPRARPVDLQNMPKTQKRPERPFGGVLCSSCSRKKIKNSV